MATTGTATFDLPGFGGQVLRPGGAGYDEARAVFNGMIDRHPELIAVCSCADDVVAAVNLARDQGLPLSVYGGGHSVTGAAVCDDGICVDMRGMKGIAVDPAAQTVRAEAGLNWGELDAATQEHGLAVTGGRVPDTGIAGLALGSGSGWLERKLGFTCDNLIAAEVVTADGRIVTASETENADLFWGLRGGGGNFGVVTAFHLQLHPIGPLVLGGLLVYPAPMAGELVRFWRDYMLGAPDEVGSALAFITAPPAEFVPEPVRGHPVVGAVVCYAGDTDEGESVLRPLREFGPPGLDLVQPMPYTAVQDLITEANPWGARNYWSADFLAELPDEAIDTLVEHATNPVSPMSQMLLVAGGGAVSRVPDDATAFGERSAPFNVHYLSVWTDAADDDRNIAYTKAISSAMKPWTTGHVYLNYIGDEGAGRVEAAFGAEKLQRLRDLKKTWDPTNLFRHNQNIKPA
jgi:FAD/FMN-containing dehydrogenase